MPYKKQLLTCLIVIITSAIYANLQETSGSQISSDSTNEDTKEKIQVKMSIQYFKKANGSESVKARVWYKEGKKNIPVENAVVNLYLEEVSKEGMMTNLITDENGEGTFSLGDRFLKRAADKYEYVFIARMMSETLYKPAETEIIVKRADFKWSISDTDSSGEVVLSCLAGPDSLVPITDTEVKLGIRRTFSILPIGDPLTSDENGMVTFAFTETVPGDSVGNLTLVAKIEDHEEFGTIESEMPVSWGIPFNQVARDKRSLWASGRNAPIPLVGVSIAIIAGIWAVLFYLVFQLIRIKNLGKKAN